MFLQQHRSYFIKPISLSELTVVRGPHRGHIFVTQSQMKSPRLHRSRTCLSQNNQHFSKVVLYQFCFPPSNYCHKKQKQQRQVRIEVAFFIHPLEKHEVKQGAQKSKRTYF